MRITGLKQTLRSLEKTGTDAQDLKKLMKDIAELIATASKTRIPVKSGRLAASVRSGSAKTKAMVYAGNGRRGKNGVPYAGIIHYGWPARKIVARPFLDQAREAKIEQATRKLIDEIGRLADINKLDNNL